MKFKELLSTCLLSALLLCSCAENSFNNYLKHFCGNREGLVLNTAITKNGETVYKTYNKNGKETILDEDRVFDLGSESKITSFYITAKAILEEKVSPNDHVRDYLSISENAYNPTIKELYTHCSAYGEYLPEHNFGEASGISNPFYKVKEDTLVSDMNAFVKPKRYSSCYSDFGMTVLGLIMEKVYNKTFLELAVPIWNDLGITSIAVNKDSSKEGSYCWDDGDAYICCMGLSGPISELVKLANSLFRTDLDYVNLAKDACNNYDGNKIGIGWRKYGSQYYQGGFVTHFSNYVSVNIERKISTVISCNKENRSFYKMRDLGDKLYNFALSNQ